MQQLTKSVNDTHIKVQSLKQSDLFLLQLSLNLGTKISLSYHFWKDLFIIWIILYLCPNNIACCTDIYAQFIHK